MTEFAVEQGRASALARSIAIATALTALAAAVVSGHGMGIVAPLAAAIIFVAVVGRLLLSWRALISIVVLIILFIPIKRYTLPASLPIRLEPYRLVVAGLVLAWLTSALIDPRVRLRRTHVIDAPLLVFVVAVLGSMIVNSNRVSSVGPDALKGLLFFMSFIAVLFLTVSLLRSWDDIDFIVRVLVVGGSVVALFALIESRTGYNVFAHLSQVVPVLRSTGVHEVDPARVASTCLCIRPAPDRARSGVRDARSAGHVLGRSAFASRSGGSAPRSSCWRPSRRSLARRSSCSSLSDLCSSGSEHAR